MGKFAYLAFATLLGACPVARCDDPKVLKDLPWHLAIVYGELDDKVEFERIEIDVEFGEQDAKATATFFLAALTVHINGVNCYAGLMNGPGITIIKNKTQKIDYDRAVFTRFSRLENAIRESDGGNSFTADHEGDHSQVSKKCPIAPGKFTFSLKAQAGREGRTQVDFSVFIHESKTSMDIGGLEFPGPKALLGESIGSFYEIVAQKPDVLQYNLSEEVRRALLVPETAFKLSNIRIDGRRIIRRDLRADYNIFVPQKAEVTLHEENQDEVIVIGSRNATFTRKNCLRYSSPEDKLKKFLVQQLK